MYEENPIFQQPEDEHIKVWRYIDFTKLVSLLESQKLFFTRADKFEDPFEGSYSKIDIAQRQEEQSWWAASMSEQTKQIHRELKRQAGNMNKHWPKQMAINCWHMNEHESAAMWKLYLKSDEGVAVQSTYSRLKSSFVDDEIIYLGKVNYADYDKEIVAGSNVMSPFVHKRKSFEHEREVRAVIWKCPIGEEGGVDFSRDTIENGLDVHIDLETLIERIYISPTAPVWFSKLVQSLVTRYKYNFEITQSSLKDKPLY